jgi:hypothetical protein
MPNQMDRSLDHEVHVRDGIAAEEQGATVCEVQLSAAEIAQIGFDGLRHDSYHAPQIGYVARSSLWPNCQA